MPLPVPLAAPVSEIHDALEEAAQVQVLPVFTASELLMPAEGADAPGTGSVTVHTGGAASCEMVKVWPPAVIVAARTGPVFGATE